MDQLEGERSQESKALKWKIIDDGDAHYERGAHLILTHQIEQTGNHCIRGWLYGIMILQIEYSNE